MIVDHAVRDMHVYDVPYMRVVHSASEDGSRDHDLSFSHPPRFEDPFPIEGICMVRRYAEKICELDGVRNGSTKNHGAVVWPVSSPHSLTQVILDPEQYVSCFNAYSVRDLFPRRGSTNDVPLQLGHGTIIIDQTRRHGTG